MVDELSWTTTNSETAYSCPGFDIQRDHVILPDGTETSYDFLVDDDTVVIIPFTPTDEVVLIEEWRQAVNHVSLGFPAGGIDIGDEALADTASRELTEETGYVPETTEYLFSAEPANGITSVVHHYFLATGCQPTSEQTLDFNESIRVTTAPFNQLVEWITDGTLSDGRTILGVLYYNTIVDP